MTDRERAIIETYTGICMLTGNKRNEVYKYMEEIMGRPVYTHELADEQIQQELKEKARPDFLKLCADQNPCDDRIVERKKEGAGTKAIITVIDDNGKVICKNQLLDPVKDEIINLHSGQPPIRETRFNFVITQLMDFQIADFQKHKEEEDGTN